MNTNQIHRKLSIQGRVQGVAYRANTRQMAQSLGLCGFVQNESDGSVYAEVEGPEDTVMQFIRWCQDGPRLARVDAIKIEKGAVQDYTGFEIRKI